MEFTYLQAVIIGSIQGVTELFPISSLGHAILLPAWIGGSFKDFVENQNDYYLLISIAIHLASSIALLLVFRKRWIKILSGSFTALKSRQYDNTQFRVFGYILIATVPVGALGLAFEDYFAEIFGNPFYSSIFLSINGLILIGAERLSRKTEKEVGFDSDQEIDAKINSKSALVIGFAQSLALFAGISRFGVSMSVGLIQKLNHSVASDFAFLISLPVILGAAVIKLPELFTGSAQDLMGQIFVGSFVSFCFTYISVTFLVRWFKTRTLYPFAIYCLLVGCISILRFS